MSRFPAPSYPSELNWPLLYLGVAMTTLATIVLELSLTRIFSVVFYYHFAFLAISIALFGLGAGGLFSYTLRGLPGRLYSRLGLLAALNSGMILALLLHVSRRDAGSESGGLAAVYLISALPFFLAGAITSTAIAETVERVDRVYFFDLLGAAAGCLLLVPLLNVLGGPNTVIGAAVLFAAASAIWFTLGGSLVGRVVAVAVALGLVGVVVLNIKGSLIDVRRAESGSPQAEIYVRWNSFSRIALAENGETGRASILIDGDASTAVADRNIESLDAGERRDLLECGAGLPYLLRPGAKTLILGPGGGWSIARAVASGSRSVTGVELNPIIANTIMRERFAGLSHRLYFRPEVRIEVGDGRSFVRRDDQKYQVIELAMPNTWNSLAAGAHAFSENSLYTVEAFTDFQSRLTPDGILSSTQWSFEPPRESLRLVTLAIEALKPLGGAAASRHVVVVREARAGRAADTVLISRSPFTDNDIDDIRRIVAGGRMEPVYLPGDRAGNPFAELLESPDPHRYWDDYPYAIEPVRDNRPFFFYTAQIGDLLGFLRNGLNPGVDQGARRTVSMLFGLVGVSVFATAIVLALPPVFLGSRVPKDRAVSRFLWFFVFVGAGYIMIQVALIQKFVMFLEHPTYALTVIIFSMLVSSGLGSYYSRRFAGASDQSLTGMLATVALLVALLAVLIPPLTRAGATWALPAKVLSTVILIAPAGFVMGMAFPSGLARLEARHRPSIRWAWSLNAAASVLGSTTAVFLAIHLGLRETLLFGGVMYLCALFTVNGARPAPRRC